MPLHNVLSYRNVMGGLAKYNTKNYEKILKEYFGDMRMIDSAACTDAPRVCVRRASNISHTAKL